MLRISKAKLLYFCAIAVLIPLLRPKLPGNSVPFDAVNAVFMAGFGIVLLARGMVTLPAGGPIAIMTAAAFIGSMVAMGSGSVVANPLYFLPFAQELYLFAFFFILASVVKTPRELRALVALVVLAAAGHAVLAAGGLGVGKIGSARATGTLVNANMAAFYFVTATFLSLTPALPLGRLARLGATGTIFVGVLSTGSITALLSTAAGVAVMLTVRMLRGGTKALLVALAAVPVVAVVAALTNNLGPPETPTLDADAGQIWVGRFDKTSGERMDRWTMTAKLAFENPMGLGIGFNRTAGGFEPHNQYLRHLLERGALGLFGLLAFYAYFLARMWRCIRDARGRDPTMMPWTAPLAGGVAAIIVFSGGNDIFHFRYFWLLLAITAAFDAATLPKRAPARAGARREASRESTAPSPG